MSDDRRMTTDRFYGGVTNRLQNLQAMLKFVRDENPSRDDLTEWVMNNTRANSADAVSHHLTFLDAVDVFHLSADECELKNYGEQWLQSRDPITLYEALNSGVKGFNVIVESLQDEPMTDENIMNLLVQEFDEAEMSTSGPAARHREWLQVLGFVDREDGVNRLTSAGHELLTKDSLGGDIEADSNVQEEITEIRRAVKSEPQLTETDTEFTKNRRRVRDAAFTELVRDTYDYQCAVCGSSRESPDGNPEVEAAHIYPKHEGGSDDPRNGIALCKLHHWAFDAGWFSLTDDHEILIKNASDRDGYHEFKQLEGESIRLPTEENAKPHPVFLQEHRQLHGFSND
jgi:putative restriction endonuclease